MEMKTIFRTTTAAILGIALAVALQGCAGSGGGQSDDEASFTMEQTISDQAQRTTLAFSGLAMLTGNLYSQSFFPPGKVADYTGFQYLRDNDPSGMGHNTSFLTRVSEDVIHVLDASQLEKLAELATAQESLFAEYGWNRYPLMQAFRRLVEGDLPAGTTGLSLAKVRAQSRALYLIDGQISYDRAALYAEIINGLDATQRASLDAMVGKGWASWPDNESADVADDVAAKLKELKSDNVAIMTYAGDIFSWYAGSVEADAYFCPERQGTYFGSFYLKDAPAISHEGYSIDTQLTATAGAALCDPAAGYVTEEQAAIVSALVDAQRDNLYAGTENIVSIREEIATALRELLDSPGEAAKQEILQTVLDLSGAYGELDGENNYRYATAFAQVSQTLTADQKANLAALRAGIMTGTYEDGTPYDYAVCSTPYLYSTPITDQATLSGYTDDAATDAYFE